MKTGWHHVVLILGLAALLVLGLSTIPAHAYDKVGAALQIIVADPAGTVGALVVLAAGVGAAIAAYRRALYTPPPEGAGTTKTRSTGEPRS